MEEGNALEDLQSNGRVSKEVRLCNVNFQDEYGSGCAGPCNKHSPTRSSEQVSVVNKEDSNGTSKSSELVNGEVGIVSPLQHDGEATIAAAAQEDNLHFDERERAYRQGNWVFREILVLLEAKLKEQTIHGAVSKRNSASADDKWKQVAEYCRSKGVQRTKEQCRVKWDNMMPDFRKIREYEEQKEAGMRSYFEMASAERRAKLLPSNMDVDVYQRVASILSNKPSRGGLKREAREKRLSDPLSSSLHALSGVHDGAEGFNGVDFGGGGMHISDFVGTHLAASAPRKRRRRKIMETALPSSFEAEPKRQVEISKPLDDSSTEDDTTYMPSRPRGIVHPYAERSSLFSQHADTSTLPPHQRFRFESREALPPSYLSLQNGHHHVVAGAERGNSTSPMEGVEEKGAAAMPESINGFRNHDIVNPVEDRKDARHKELMALEREKLAVFREASLSIANAMTSAMAMFSKVAEELLLRHQ